MTPFLPQASVSSSGKWGLPRSRLGCSQPGQPPTLPLLFTALRLAAAPGGRGWGTGGRGGGSAPGGPRGRGPGPAPSRKDGGCGEAGARPAPAAAGAGRCHRGPGAAAAAREHPGEEAAKVRSGEGLGLPGQATCKPICPSVATGRRWGCVMAAPRGTGGQALLPLSLPKVGRPVCPGFASRPSVIISRACRHSGASWFGY